MLLASICIQQQLTVITTQPRSHLKVVVIPVFSSYTFYLILKTTLAVNNIYKNSKYKWILLYNKCTYVHLNNYTSLLACLVHLFLIHQGKQNHEVVILSNAVWRICLILIYWKIHLSSITKMSWLLVFQRLKKID